MSNEDFSAEDIAEVGSRITALLPSALRGLHPAHVFRVLDNKEAGTVQMLKSGFKELIKSAPAPATKPAKTTASAPGEIIRMHVVNENTIKVNLDAPPLLPFPAAKVISNKGEGMGWVTIELREGRLYQDGLRILLHQDDGQKQKKGMTRDKLYKALELQTLVHPNVLEAVTIHSLVADNFKQTATLYHARPAPTYSLAVIYGRGPEECYVVGWYFHNGGFLRTYKNLKAPFDDHDYIPIVSPSRT